MFSNHLKTPNNLSMSRGLLSETKHTHPANQQQQTREDVARMLVSKEILLKIAKLVPTSLELPIPNTCSYYNDFKEK